MERCTPDIIDKSKASKEPVDTFADMVKIRSMETVLFATWRLHGETMSKDVSL